MTQVMLRYVTPEGFFYKMYQFIDGYVKSVVCLLFSYAISKHSLGTIVDALRTM